MKKVITFLFLVFLFSCHKEINCYHCKIYKVTPDKSYFHVEEASFWLCDKDKLFIERLEESNTFADSLGYGKEMQCYLQER